METKFTPGTWVASIEKRPEPSRGHWYVVLDDAEDGIGEFYGEDHETNAANVRMAAAAPALYEALDALFTDPQFQVSIGGNPNMVEALMARCNAALALARGEHPTTPRDRGGMDPATDTGPNGEKL